MIDNMLVADATAHGYNWTAENLQIPEAAPIVSGSFGFHQFLTTNPDHVLTEDEFVRDWPVDEVADTLFYEGCVDVVCHHGTPIYDFFKDGHAATHKGYDLKATHPKRALAYAAINPFELADADAIRAEVDKAADAGADGLKLYAARYANGQTFEQRLDDTEFAFPMIERALERGIKSIATHKAVPIGPVHFEPYGCSDIPLACSNFPEMSFEVVHTGMAFVEETVFLAMTQPNCFFNLETSFATIGRQPRRFAEFLGALLSYGAADRLLYASGMSLVHPLHSLQAFMEFEMPADLVRDRGYPEMSDDIRRGILGENFLRLHGVDAAKLKAEIADDAVAQRQAGGLEHPWSNVRASMNVHA